MRRRYVIGALAALTLVAAWVFTPWPSLIAYRIVMDAWGVVDNVTAAKHVPPDIEEQRDIAYLPGEAATRLDVFRPRNVPAKHCLCSFGSTAVASCRATRRTSRII